MAENMEPSVQCLENHVAVRIDDFIVILSLMEHGDVPGEKVLEIWRYNLWTEQWRQCPTIYGKHLPSTTGRTGQHAVPIESVIYMYCQCFTYCGKLMIWKLTRCSDHSFGLSTIYMEGKSKMPSPRCSQCVWEYDDKMLIFGGYGPSPTGFLVDHGFFFRYGSLWLNNQLCSNNPSSQTWQNVQCSGDVPEPQMYASVARIQNKVWLYGGSIGPSNIAFYEHKNFYEMNMTNLSWTRIDTNTPFPKPMLNSPLPLAPATANEIVLFTGPIGFRHPSSWILDVHTHTWKQYRVSENYYSHGHTGTTGLQSSVLILGGYAKTAQRLAYRPVFSVMLEPKSLQQVAMRIIYRNRRRLPWKSLPAVLRRKMRWIKVPWAISLTRKNDGHCNGHHILMSDPQSDPIIKHLWIKFEKTTFVSCVLSVSYIFTWRSLEFGFRM